MKTCALCNIGFSDGVQCAACKGYLDFGCAGISENGWRRLGSDRRSTWKCPACRISSPSPSPALTPEPVSIETVLHEIRDIKAQLINLPCLLESIKTMKEELNSLKVSHDFNSGQLQDFSTRLTGLETRMVTLERLQDSVQSLQSDVDTIKSEQAASDQRSRLNNIEIKGIPLRKDENLFSILDKVSDGVKFALPRTQINYISRVPTYNSREKSIIVGFLNRYVKEDFVAAARLCRDLSTRDLGFDGPSNRIFVNDHLNSGSKKLLNKTRLLAKERDFRYVWVKHSKIHVRRQDGSPVIIISSERDLNKLN
ncbi:uncharacterized protein LOC111359599 [Spodoptera litura]|uniref:Uncharacterized protein LOC111359599 n=1 Tax=Spodoptera litura TaxID=69820 RepID=A0A9J7EMC2_SPOLT|nr:uncharacterized protein LOC111359599 [Spodoptera litura]